MIRNNSVTYAGTLGGLLLVLMGLLGFCVPKLMGVPFSPLLNLMHLASGIAAAYFGLKCTSLAAGRTFCMSIGVLYSGFGLANLVLGGLGNTLLYGIVGAGFITAAVLQPLRSTRYSPR